MAAASARTVLPKVLELEHRQLTERRLEWALGRRKRKTRARKKKRKKKRRRRRKRKRRSRKPRTNSQQGNRT
ncbi:MAG: hypothetical protein GY725_20750 [bacterium]|nr:hypothetical protein [bacterium]